jgi:hypothetical protein
MAVEPGKLAGRSHRLIHLEMIVNPGGKGRTADQFVAGWGGFEAGADRSD